MIPKNLKKAVVSQFDSNDCGAACLLSILKYYDRDENLEVLKNLSGTTKNGTTLLGLQEALDIYNIQSTGYRVEIDNLKNQKNPVILHVNIDQSFNHYVVCYGYHDGEFRIVDPLLGYTPLDDRSLEAIWKSNKLLLIEEVGDVGEMKTSSNINWLYDLAKNHVDKLLSALLLGFLIAILSLSTAFFAEAVVDKFISKNLLNDSVQLILLWASLLLISELLSYARSIIIIKQVFEFNIGLMSQYFSKILSMNARFFDSKEVGDLVARMGDAEMVEETITEIIGETLIDLLIVMIVSAYLFFMDTSLGLLVIGSLLLYVGIALRNNVTLIRLQRNLVLSHSKRESKFIDVFNNIDIIKSYNLEKKFLGSINDQYRSYESEKLNLDNHINRFDTSVNLAQLFVLLASFLFVALGVFSGDFGVGSLFASFILVTRFNASIKKFIILNVNLQGSLISISRLKDFANFDLTIDPFAKSTNPVNVEPDTNQRIVLETRKLSFKYPGYLEIISGANFKVNQDTITGICGSNGGGKSTFLKVMKRLYEPTSGDILINGISHKNYSILDWNKMFSYVEQNPKLINGSVFTNISMGGHLSEDELTNFLVDNNFSSFLDTLPDGIRTQVGLGGIPISGGQKQIISILRGVLSQSQIILFDEPTSSIDESFSHLILDLMRKIKNEKIIIISSHDEEILKKCDQVYLLNDKKLELAKIK